MTDKIETINGTVIQHGPLNKRIYVMHLSTADTGHLITALDTMAHQNSYDKIFAKIPATRWKAFKLDGYTREATVPGLFNAKTDGFFIAKYMTPQRQQDQRLHSFNPQEYETQQPQYTSDPQHPVALCTPADASEMGAVFQQVFSTYPFPIQNTAYLKEMMAKGVCYYCIRIKDKIAALAAMEIDTRSRNCEMTDFATLRPWRGRGLARHLLDHMDIAACKADIKTSYTIARAASAGMNLVFKNNGYRYGGVLINNSQICGSIQSMTVWYKHL